MVDLGGLDYFLRQSIHLARLATLGVVRSFSLPLRRTIRIVVVVVVVAAVAVGKVVDDAIRRVVVAVLVRVVVVTVGRRDQSLHPSLLLPPGGWILW